MEIQDKHKNEQEEKFENDAVDPGFESSTEQPSNTKDDKHSIDTDLSTETGEEKKIGKGDRLKDQVGEQENGKDDDAMNYKSDREHGAYNSKNA